MNYKEQLSLKQEKQVRELVASFPVFAKKYFDHLKSAEMSSATILHYAYDVQRFFNFLKSSAGFRNMDMKAKTAQEILGNLRPEDFDEYMASFDEKPAKKGAEPERYSAQYKNAKAVSLRGFVRYYYTIGELDEDVSRFITLARAMEKPAKAMNRDEVSKILSAVFETEALSGKALENKELTMKRDYALMMLLFGTGIRVAELAGIDISDIDFYEASIDVGRKGKGTDKNDVVYFGPEVEEALRDYIDKGRPALLAGRSTDALFISLQHKRMSVRNIQMMTKAYGEKAGINHHTNPHAFRKTYGTSLYQSTGDIYLVATALNHSSVETTARHYIERNKEDRRKAASKASDLFKDED